MWVWDVPRSQIKDQIIKKSGGLQRDPGAGYKGDCDLFQAPKASPDAEPTDIPVCRGNCPKGGTCILAIVAWEGRYSDVYDVNVFCTCMTSAELHKWAHAKKGQVIDLDGKAACG
jgi:hypothetical protein